MIDISLSYSSYTVEKKKKKKKKWGHRLRFPPVSPIVVWSRFVCWPVPRGRCFVACFPSTRLTLAESRSSRDKSVCIGCFLLVCPLWERNDSTNEGATIIVVASLSMERERERESQQRCCASKAGRTEMLGPGTYTRSLHYTHERRRPSPFSPGRDSALSLSLSLSPGLDELHDSCCCVSKTIPCCCANASPVPLFIYLLDVARKKKKEEEKRGTSIWLFIRVGAVVYFSHHSTAAETTKEISIYRASAASAASRSNAIIPGRV